MDSSAEITRLLAEVSAGGSDAADELLGVLYRELHLLAQAAMKGERSGHTLQPTALVHEAYLRLMQDERQDWHNRAHFFGAAATAMRRVLVDHARRRQAEKRGGGALRVTAAAVELEASGSGGPGESGGPDALDVLAVDEALTELARVDARKSRLVELRFFVGLGFKEAAQVLGISEVTAKRDWNFAKAWLYRRISSEKDRIR